MTTPTPTGREANRVLIEAGDRMRAVAEFLRESHIGEPAATPIDKLVDETRFLEHGDTSSLQGLEITYARCSLISRANECRLAASRVPATSAGYVRITLERAVELLEDNLPGEPTPTPSAGGSWTGARSFDRHW